MGRKSKKDSTAERRKYYQDRKKTPGKMVEDLIKSKAHHRQKKLELIMYKGGKCEHCGLIVNNENQCVFEFHHIDPTLKKGERIPSMGPKTAKDAITKCILLCSNCHKILHYNGEVNNESH